MRPLFLGVLVAGAVACGGAPGEDEQALESSTPVASDDVGAVEQKVCTPGSFTGSCRDYGSGGYADPGCSGSTPYMWSFWNCSQYQYGSSSTAQYDSDFEVGVAQPGWTTPLSVTAVGAKRSLSRSRGCSKKRQDTRVSASSTAYSNNRESAVAAMLDGMRRENTGRV